MENLCAIGFKELPLILIGIRKSLLTTGIMYYQDQELGKIYISYRIIIQVSNHDTRRNRD